MGPRLTTRTSKPGGKSKVTEKDLASELLASRDLLAAARKKHREGFVVVGHAHAPATPHGDGVVWTAPARAAVVPRRRGPPSLQAPAADPAALHRELVRHFAEQPRAGAGSATLLVQFEHGEGRAEPALAELMRAVRRSYSQAGGATLDAAGEAAALHLVGHETLVAYWVAAAGHAFAVDVLARAADLGTEATDWRQPAVERWLLQLHRVATTDKLAWIREVADGRLRSYAVDHRLAPEELEDRLVPVVVSELLRDVETLV